MYFQNKAIDQTVLGKMKIKQVASSIYQQTVLTLYILLMCI